MDAKKMLYVSNRDEWRAWLEANHAIETIVWLVFYKQHSGQPSIAYDDAVEEALCFGWIDSVIQRLDDNRYCRKFTPRKNGSKWSASNKARVARLIQAGRMTEAGLAKLNYSGSGDDYGRTPGQPAEAPAMPEFFNRALESNPAAREVFNHLAPSHRRRYLLWITTAKTDETRKRRVAEAIQLLAENKKLGLK